MRGRIPLTILAPDGRPAAGANVTITDRDTSTAATIYTAETGAGTLSTTGAGVTGATGRLAGWLDRGGYEALVTGVAGADPTLEDFEVAPARDGAIDLEWLAAELAGTLSPPGVPVPLLTDTVPAGFIECDGSEFLNTDAPQQAAALGTTWGAAAAGHTKTPDLRGRALVGADLGAGRMATNNTVGATGGASTRGAGEIPVPNHNHDAPGNTADPRFVVAETASPVLVTAAGAGTTVIGAGGIDSFNITGPVGPNALPATLDVRQPYAVVRWILKAI